MVAANAWVAEGFAKALLLHGGANAFDLLPDGIEAMTIGDDGIMRTTTGLRRFTGPQSIPQQISLYGAVS